MVYQTTPKRNAFQMLTLVNYVQAYTTFNGILSDFNSIIQVQKVRV